MTRPLTPRRRRSIHLGVLVGYAVIVVLTVFYLDELPWLRGAVGGLGGALLASAVAKWAKRRKWREGVTGDEADG
ncbi:hypothetical protein [Actinosynnema sp. NPDC020468]|uniref:hypothetical protein n=1 Tax=Actinosynnema sp. NPDC020468 TaxID=3154488 RepID=UPI0033F7449B